MCSHTGALRVYVARVSRTTPGIFRLSDEVSRSQLKPVQCLRARQERARARDHGFKAEHLQHLPHRRDRSGENGNVELILH